MTSVTQRTKQVKQPRGGYLPVKHFEVTPLPLKETLHPAESVSPHLIGVVVDYLNRLVSGSHPAEAFRISLKSAFLLGDREKERAAQLLNDVKGLDDASIRNACQLVGYDTVLRAGPHTYRPVEQIFADDETVANIRMMVERSQSFLKDYGPVTVNGIAFGLKSLGKHITSGDGDFATADTLWDMKVSKNPPKIEHTLQLLVYYLMGLRSDHLADAFDRLAYLGFYNPRLHAVYRLPLKAIPDDIINTVKREVIGYDDV